MKKKIVSFFKTIITIISDQKMQIIPGQVAFSFLLSLIPLIALAVVIAGWFSISIDSVIELVKNTLPPRTSELLIPIISGKGLDFGIILFVFTSFLLASNGADSIIIISNFLYKIKNAIYIKRRIKSILLTIIVILLLGFLLIIPIFGDLIMNFITGFSFTSSIKEELLMIYSIVKVPTSLLVVYFAVKVIYTVAPDTKISGKETTYGALFTTFGWFLVSWVYSYYTTHFSRYDILYGSIANLIILLLWIYLISYILVIGIAINTSLKEYDIKSIN